MLYILRLDFEPETAAPDAAGRRARRGRAGGMPASTAVRQGRPIHTRALRTTVKGNKTVKITKANLDK